ncbi:MAG: HD domain-containing protein [Candidatus Levyibacteriota bacterium]
MKIIDFYRYLDKLKRTKREGWIADGIMDSESVADHSLSVAALSMVLAPHLNVDRDKLIKMALIHDIGESIIGDVQWYTQGKGIDKKVLAKKEKDEGKAVRKILETLGDSEYLKLWEEMEEKKTREAKIHKEIDRIDMALQAYFNEKRTGKNLARFFDFTDLFISEPLIKEIMKEVRSSRK